MRYPSRRSDDIKRLVLAALTAVVIAVPASPQPSQAASSAACPTGLFKITDYRWYASRVYRRDTITWRAHRRMARMLRCQHSPKASALVERYHQRYLRQRAARALAARRAARLPFVGPDGRRWAIPWPIVRCESGGSWTAHNPTSPARGPYQLLSHGEPWPVNSEADKQAHHRIAANLWAGGAGRSHWVC